MFKLPDGLPQVRTSAQDWADYAEYLALTNKKISFYELVKPSKLVSDEEMIGGVEDESDKFSTKADEIANEIRLRIHICGEKYPFTLTDNDYVLLFEPKIHESTIIYCYLLLATRAQMSKDRVQKEIDGALLFEKLCATVAKNYFGERAEVDILGTSKEEVISFRAKLKELIKKMGEGGSIHENPGHRPQDDSVDVIVWKGFSDNQPSKVIAFGQCKTGTSWVNHITELSTEGFCKNWFTRQPVVTPIRAFFTAQYFPREIFIIRANNAGLVFDRFRIIDYLPETIGDELLASLVSWNVEIVNFYSKKAS
ncbi:hypothetical protein [Pedobacter glucosidilyticus]|uniref:hypothetical protein n=1 Tax=Pedobacter glucosidilyticus TaxID=1122941 RepID=UPI000412976B|nr:hypothetical protein [Pedobacter glucosidilyticus]